MKRLATVFISLFRLCRGANSLCLPKSLICKPVFSVQFCTGKYDPETDKPIDMPDPYQKPKKKCFICEKNIPLDYKNVRLLSQFVSPYTGRIYGRHITGMCIPMQKRISQLITRSRQFGFMPFESKETVFISDPRIPALSRSK